MLDKIFKHLVPIKDKQVYLFAVIAAKVSKSFSYWYNEPLWLRRWLNTISPPPPNHSPSPLSSNCH